MSIPDSAKRFRRRSLAGVLTLLACLSLFGIYRLLPHPPAHLRAAAASKTGSAALQWGHEEWIYTYSPGSGEKPNCEPKAMTLSGTDIYVTGLVQTEQEDADILTLKVSQDGKLLWRRRYSSPEHDCDRAYSIANAPQGGVYVAGESYIPASPGGPAGWRLVVIRYAEDGTPLWSQHFPFITKNADMAIQVLPHRNNGCWVGGTALVNGVPHLLVLRYDESGKFLWKQTAKQESTFSHLAGQNDDIFACGTTRLHNTHGPDGQWLVTCFDRNGKHTWEQTVEGPGQGGTASHIFQEGNALYVSGVFQMSDAGKGEYGINPGVAKLSAEDGQLLRICSPQGTSLGYQILGISLELPGFSIIGERTLLHGGHRGEITRYDPSLIPIWNQEYTAPSGYSDLGLCPTRSGALGLSLTPVRPRADGGNDLLALGLGSDGRIAYTFGVRPGGKGAHSPRAIAPLEGGIIYLAALSFSPERPTITITKLRMYSPSSAAISPASP